MNEDFYQARILETARTALGAGQLADATGRAEVDNPLCGDRVRIDVRVAGDAVEAVAHRVRGCILCEAAAALIAAGAPGQRPRRLSTLADEVRAMLAEGDRPPPEGWEALEMFAPVAARPSRHDCVVLPFEALRQALATPR